MLNVLFAIGILISYVFWPGGGEGARARATALIAFHLALFFWGILIFGEVGQHCARLVGFFFLSRGHESLWGEIFAYQRFCIVYNGLLFAFVAIHEAILGKYIGTDLTLLPATFCGPKPWRYEDQCPSSKSSPSAVSAKATGDPYKAAHSPYKAPSSLEIVQAYASQAQSDSKREATLNCENTFETECRQGDSPTQALVITEAYLPVIPNGFA